MIQHVLGRSGRVHIGSTSESSGESGSPRSVAARKGRARAKTLIQERNDRKSIGPWTDNLEASKEPEENCNISHQKIDTRPPSAPSNIYTETETYMPSRVTLASPHSRHLSHHWPSLSRLSSPILIYTIYACDALMTRTCRSPQNDGSGYVQAPRSGFD
ncbi:hypothetical protein VTJ04DRAFT_1279 [Mycothermus thermophilus]|uniref:uncharacterized protein n=1 Tax=Humicola insolens TaxID=85995 RepID=UPI0037439DDA